MFSDVNDALEHWNALFLSVIDRHLPLRSKRVKRQTQPAWFNPLISGAIRNRNLLLAQATRYNTDLLWQEYRIARNRVNHLIRQSKREFYQESIRSNLDNPRQLWRIIRSLAPGNYSKLPSHLSVNDNNYSKSIDIANLFNLHFSNIASSVHLDPVESTVD